MIRSEARTCNGCGTEVSYEIFDDAHMVEEVKEFVGTRQGLQVITEFCLTCGVRLTLHSTSPITPNDDSAGDEDLKESMRQQALNDD